MVYFWRAGYERDVAFGAEDRTQAASPGHVTYIVLEEEDPEQEPEFVKVSGRDDLILNRLSLEEAYVLSPYISNRMAKRFRRAVKMRRKRFGGPLSASPQRGNHLGGTRIPGTVAWEIRPVWIQNIISIQKGDRNVKAYCRSPW